MNHSDFEDRLTTNLLQAEAIAGVVSLIRDVLDEAHERWKYAKTSEDVLRARYDTVRQVSRLLPVLEMLTDYTKGNYGQAEDTLKKFEEMVKNG